MASCYAQDSAECPLMRLLQKAIDLLANGITELCRRIRSVFRRRWRKRRCFSAEEVEQKVMRLADNRRSRLARDIRAFVASIRRRPLRQPDGDWKTAFADTRRQLTATRTYLARKLGVGGSEEEQDALERCVERLLYEPVRNDLYLRAMLGLFMERCVRDMAALVRRHRSVGVPPARLGAPELSPAARQRVRRQLEGMQSARLPCDKLAFLVSAAEHATQQVEEENGIIVNSDNLLPLMSWMLMDTGMTYALVEAELMQALLPPEKDCGKAGFYLTTLYCACLCIHTRAEPQRRVKAAAPATVNVIAEPTVNAIAEPIVNAIAEPIVNDIAEPIVNAIAELIVNAIAEPTTVNAIAEPTVSVVTETTVDIIIEPTVNAVTYDEAAEVADDMTNEATSCDEEIPAVSSWSDDDEQKHESQADNSEEPSEGYWSSGPDRESSLGLLDLETADNNDHDSCFGDDELSFQSKASLSSCSSGVDLDSLSAENDSGTWCLCRSVSNLSIHSSDQSLYEFDCVNNKTAQLVSAGTLFSAVPVFLSGALLA